MDYFWNGIVSSLFFHFHVTEIMRKKKQRGEMYIPEEKHKLLAMEKDVLITKTKTLSIPKYSYPISNILSQWFIKTKRWEQSKHKSHADNSKLHFYWFLTMIKKNY